MEHRGDVLCARYSPDGSRIATVGVDAMVRFWDARTGKQLVSFFGSISIINFAQFTPDGKQLVTANKDGTARLWPATLEGFEADARAILAQAPANPRQHSMRR